LEEHERALRTHNGTLMDKMLELQKKYHEARMERDRLVYDLYGLMEEEIKVVEEK